MHRIYIYLLNLSNADRTSIVKPMSNLLITFISLIASKIRRIRYNDCLIVFLIQVISDIEG